MIRGSAVNNDGGGNGLTAPNPGRAGGGAPRGLRAGGRSTRRDVDYVELHGTGTPLGDPVEAAALGAVARVTAATRTAPLPVGSVKTNIGHLEAAAGIAGLIKTVLSLERRELPADLHFDSPTRTSRSTSCASGVQTALEPWPERRRRIAGVSSFGFGGTNCHVVVAAAPQAGAEARRWRPNRRVRIRDRFPSFSPPRAAPALREGAWKRTDPTCSRGRTACARRTSAGHWRPPAPLSSDEPS